MNSFKFEHNSTGHYRLHQVSNERKVSTSTALILQAGLINDHHLLTRYGEIAESISKQKVVEVIVVDLLELLAIYQKRYAESTDPTEYHAKDAKSTQTRTRENTVDVIDKILGWLAVVEILEIRDEVIPNLGEPQWEQIWTIMDREASMYQSRKKLILNYLSQRLDQYFDKDIAFLTQKIAEIRSKYPSE